MTRGQINTREQARQKAKDWQIWQQDKSFSYLELAKWQAYFEEIAEKFRLKTEF